MSYVIFNSLFAKGGQATLAHPQKSKTFMDLVNFFIQLLNSFQYGLLLFMLAAGLTLIFGIMGVVNLAHGSFYMLGAYLAWSLSDMLGSYVLAILVGLALSVVFGLLLEKMLFRLFYQRDHLAQVLLTFGLIYVF